MRFGAILQDVSVISFDGTHLQGWFIRPARFMGNAVILFHGIGDNRQGMLGFAELFLSHGYSVLLPDSRGLGLSGGLPTYGSEERNDVRQWYGWLASHEQPRCIYGMGESMGAAIMLQAIKEVPFCAVVAESPFANFRDIAYIRVGQFFYSGDWVGRIILRPAVDFAFHYCRLKYGVSLSDISPEMAVVGNRVPILLIHGMSDSNIPLQQSERIFQRSPRSIKFWKVPDANHCGAMSADRQEFERRVLGWYSSHSAYRVFP
jgi:dipeptidyl aminopeptidase/acylaminoacyl peptidase